MCTVVQSSSSLVLGVIWLFALHILKVIYQSVNQSILIRHESKYNVESNTLFI